MERKPELDLGRVLAMLAVVAIHVSSGYIYAESAFSPGGMNPAYVLNQAGRFCVPLFILLSGASLGLRSGKEAPLRFWLSRLKKLGVPYLIWWAVYQFSAIGFRLSRLGELPCLAQPLRSLLLGWGAPHLYFVPVLFQLYLLTPLLRPAARRFPRASLLLSFLLSLPANWLVDMGIQGYHPIPGLPGSLLWMLFPCWIFYYVCGLVAGQRMDRLSPMPKGLSPLWLLCTLAVLIAYLPHTKATGSLGSITPAMLPITLLVFLSCCSLRRPLERFTPLRRIVSFLAAHSMSVYFCHVLLLELWRKIYLPGMHGMLILLILVTLSSLLFAWLLDSLLARVKKALRRRAAG